MFAKNDVKKLITYTFLKSPFLQNGCMLIAKISLQNLCSQFPYVIGFPKTLKLSKSDI